MQAPVDSSECYPTYDLKPAFHVVWRAYTADWTIGFLKAIKMRGAFFANGSTGVAGYSGNAFVR
jgi:hypothetical protein